MGSRPALSLAICLLAGLAQAASIATPWDGQPLWWLQILSLATLVWQLRGAASWPQAALRGWLFAIAWLAGIFWWLFISMHGYGGLAAPLAVAAVLALAAFLASYYALASGSFWLLARVRACWAAPVFGALWLLAELMRTTWFTGFPWGAGGYAHGDGPLAVLAPWAGVHGIGLAAATLAGALALLAGAVQRRRWALALPAAVLAGLLAVAQALPSGAALSQGSGTMAVALLQGNIPQNEKFQLGSGVPLALDWYAQQLTRSTATLVVAPETAIPLLPHQLPEGYLKALGAHFGAGQQAALVGIPLGSHAEGYSNSVIGLKPGGGEIYRYDKHHLVPFGEFIPPLFRWFTAMMNIPLGDFERGAVGQASFEWKGQRLAPNICYEDLFGEELGARFADEAGAPTLLVNVSNIGWFGNTVAIDQHLQISRMRALEFARPMLRATNTGATALIDHRGRVLQELPRHTRGVLLAEAEGRRGVTPYAWWVARLGLWPLWLLALGLPALAYAMRTRRPGRAPVT